MKKLSTTIVSLIFVFLGSCTHKNSETNDTDTRQSESFSFAFLTDVHLNRNNKGNGNDGLRMALDNAKQHHVDFVIFGGDNADVDAMAPDDEATADSLVSRFKSIVDSSGIKSYYTIGNQDRYYTFNAVPDSAGFNLFQKHFGKTYYSFDHKGIHFIVLNSVQRDAQHTYFVNDEQFRWLQNDLAQTGHEKPLVVITHVPFQSLYYPAVEGRIVPIDMLDNFKQVWDALSEYNLKIILQGHQHLHEELFVRNTWFLTGGAVSAGWWGGEFYTTQEGYLLISVDSHKNFSWKYVDYGWDAKK